MGMPPSHVYYGSDPGEKRPRREKAEPAEPMDLIQKLFVLVLSLVVLGTFAYAIYLGFGGPEIV